MIKEINSLQNETVKRACLLKNSKNIKENNMFLIEGEHLVEMAKDYLVAVFTLKKLDLNDDIDQYIVSEAILKKISNQQSFPSVIGVCKTIDFSFKEEDILIYLENVQNPGNLGSILRTALGLNVKNIILSNDCCSIYNQKCIQSSQGAIFSLNVIYRDIDYLNELKNKGYTLVASVLNKDSIPLKNLKRDGKTVLIFGNEGTGLSKKAIEMSDYKVIIPIQNIDSFNVSNAFSIILYDYLFNK